MFISLTAQQAGASAKDALRSIVISEQLLGTTEILLIKHTGCGMLTFNNEDAYVIVEKNLGCVAPPSGFGFSHGLSTTRQPNPSKRCFMFLPC